MRENVNKYYGIGIGLESVDFSPVITENGIAALCHCNRYECTVRGPNTES